MTPLRPLAAVAALAWLAGCAAHSAPIAGAAPASAAPASAAPAAAGPQASPQRIVTGFTGAVRCMDEQLYTFGVRDVSVMMEELLDKTGRTGAAARDMMISALADMTRRSRALKVITFGSDATNTLTLLQTAGRSNPFAVLPDYSIRGAISQFDDELLRKSASAGFSIPALLGLRGGTSISYNAIGFDATVVTTRDFALVPGASSKNSVVIGREETSASDGLAQVSKVGLTFSFAVSRNDSIAQGVRNMVELASVELVGKLLRMPYWNCLEADRRSPEIVREIDDWFVSMNDEERIAWFQEQLRNRKFWDGPLTGKLTDPFEQAVAAYRAAIGLSAEPTVDRVLFERFLDDKPPKPPRRPFAEPPGEPAAAAGSGDVKTAGDAKTAGDTKTAAGDRNAGDAPGSDDAGPALEAPKLKIASTKRQLAPDERYEIDVLPERDAYVYCYVKADSGTIHRVFPNRFQKDPRRAGGKVLRLPGGGRFTLRAVRTGSVQNVGCLAAPREVYNDLPPPLRWGDFDEVRVTSFADIRDGFEKAGGVPVTLVELEIPVGARR